MAGSLYLIFNSGIYYVIPFKALKKTWDWKKPGDRFNIFMLQHFSAVCCCITRLESMCQGINFATKGASLIYVLFPMLFFKSP